jgi:mRNA-degrading endonuclease toxin of MazEF toxin-antitoxin module
METIGTRRAPGFKPGQRGRRPVIVLSSDSFNRVQGWRSVVVVPLSTSDTQRRRGPTAIPVPAGEGGLTRAGVALCHQVTTLDRGKRERRLGRLPDTRRRLVGLGVMAALDLL